MVKIQVDNYYAAIKLIEILYEKGLLNQTTYFNIIKASNPQT